MRIGEVIEAATFSFGAECAQLHHPPALGSLVKTREGEVEIYGVVASATTTSIEPGRPAVALSRGEGQAEDVFHHHPQLAQLLCTRFQAVVVGHREEGRLCPYLPPRPPHLHSPVHLCPPEEEREFGASLDFLSLLLSTTPQGREEVVAACLRHLSHSQPDPLSFLMAAGKELTRLLPGQAVALNAILRRLRQ